MLVFRTGDRFLSLLVRGDISVICSFRCTLLLFCNFFALILMLSIRGFLFVLSIVVLQMETIAISNSTPNYLHPKLLKLQKLRTLLQLMGVIGRHRGPDSAQCATGAGELVQVYSPVSFLD